MVWHGGEESAEVSAEGGQGGIGGLLEIEGPHEVRQGWHQGLPAHAQAM
jgi:hypothetical protein